MKVRRLTPAEDLYVQTLCLRQLHITELIKPFTEMPLEELWFGWNPQFGMTNLEVWSLLVESAAWTDQEINEALS